MVSTAGTTSAPWDLSRCAHLDPTDNTGRCVYSNESVFWCAFVLLLLLLCAICVCRALATGVAVWCPHDICGLRLIQHKRHLPTHLLTHSLKTHTNTHTFKPTTPSLLQHQQVRFSVPKDAVQLDFVFSNVESGEGIYDNRGGFDYHLPIEGGTGAVFLYICV